MIITAQVRAKPGLGSSTREKYIHAIVFPTLTRRLAPPKAPALRSGGPRTLYPAASEISG